MSTLDSKFADVDSTPESHPQSVDLGGLARKFQTFVDHFKEFESKFHTEVEPVPATDVPAPIESEVVEPPVIEAPEGDSIPDKVAA